jgi:hypothetical protein
MSYGSEFIHCLLVSLSVHVFWFCHLSFELSIVYGFHMHGYFHR